MKKYDGKELRSGNLEQLQQIAISEGISIDGKKRSDLLKELVALEVDESEVESNAEGSSVESEVNGSDVVEETAEGRASRIAYEHALARRLGSHRAATYGQELARRRGAGSHVSGEDAYAMELAHRQKVYGK